MKNSKIFWAKVPVIIGEGKEFHVNIDFSIDKCLELIKGWIIVLKRDYDITKQPMSFKINDTVKLKNIEEGSGNAKYNGCKGVITDIKVISAFYYAYNSYKVIAEYGDEVTELTLSEGNMDLWADEEEVWPPKCICERFALLNKGCECGAWEKEKKGKPEPKKPKNDSFEITI